jgi:peptidoglycan-N-acetylglucosamine deacetylase
LKVALTVDTEHPDQPHRELDGPTRILDALAERSIAATFFVQGRWVQAFPELGARIAAEGHLVGCHSWSHAPMTWLGSDHIVRDLGDATKLITEITGMNPRPWFRLPYFDGQDDARVIEAVRNAGYSDSVPANVDTIDWRPETTVEEWQQRVLGGVAAADPAVVLMHSWPTCTAEALPVTLDALIERGAEFITVDSLPHCERRRVHWLRRRLAARARTPRPEQAP